MPNCSPINRWGPLKRRRPNWCLPATSPPQSRNALSAECPSCGLQISIDQESKQKSDPGTRWDLGKANKRKARPMAPRIFGRQIRGKGRGAGGCIAGVVHALQARGDFRCVLGMDGRGTSSLARGRTGEHVNIPRANGTVITRELTSRSRRGALRFAAELSVLAQVPLSHRG